MTTIQPPLKKYGVIPSFLLGGILAIAGVWFCNLLINYTWLVPIDNAQFTPISRRVVLGTIDSITLLQVSDWRLIALFLAGVSLVGMGFFLPLSYYLNRRLHQKDGYWTPFLVLLRQALWWGILIAFSVWMQINRSLWLPLVLLVAIIFILLEGYFFVRRRSLELNLN